MKGIILEARKNEAVALTRDGRVRRIKGRYQVGQRVTLPRTGKALTHIAALAAALVMMLAGGAVWARDNLTAYADVSLDLNPSIEYTLNRCRRVISVHAHNEAGVAVVQALTNEGIRFSPLTEALDKTLSILTDEGYLTEETEDYLLISVSADDEETINTLTSEAVSSLDKASRRDHSLTYAVSATDRDTAGKARDVGLSAGRYSAWETSGAAETDEASLEEYARKDVSEVMAMVERRAESPRRPNEEGRVPDDEPRHSEDTNPFTPDSDVTGERPMLPTEDARPPMTDPDSAQTQIDDTAPMTPPDDAAPQNPAEMRPDRFSGDRASPDNPTPEGGAMPQPDGDFSPLRPVP